MQKPREQIQLFDSSDTIGSWRTVDDVVMGGVSRSRIQRVGDSLRFEGEVSLEQNGGFCSARSDGQWDLTGASELFWTLRGTARQFQATIRTADIPASASFRHGFTPSPDQWQEFSFPLEDFRLFRRGEKLSEEILVEPGEILAFGILLADKSAGPFWLEIAQMSYG